MKSGALTVSIILYLVLLFTALRAYIKVNHGKEKHENRKVNQYIYISIGIGTISTLLNLLLIIKFL